MNQLGIEFKYPLTELPTSALAYVGDSYFDLFLHTWLLRELPQKSGQLHKKSIQFANARFQAGLAKSWVDNALLNEDELAVLLRGRNGNPGSMAKNASPAEYRWATGLETLIGYLFLDGKTDRIENLLVPAFLAKENE